MSQQERELETLGDEARSAIEAAGDLEALREVEVAYLGRKSRLKSEILRGLRDLPDELKRVIGPAANELASGLEELIERRRIDLEREAEEELLSTDRIDLSLPGRRPPRGVLHPLTEVTRLAEDVFVGMGYEVAEGPEAETDWHNFQALNSPEHHPSRSLMDTYYLSGPAGPMQALLRTHTSPVQVRVMERQAPPIYVVCPGRVFRHEDITPTNSNTFHQVEGLAVDEGISFAELRGTLAAFAEGIFGEGTAVRLVPSFYPFTEPSAELQITCPLCSGEGCNQCASGWLGMGGAGMVHPNVFEFVGIDPERYTGFAFGLSLDRIPILRFGIPDIRLLLEGDLRFGEQFRATPVTG